MGLRTIAVYSEADSAAPHVRMADQAVLLGVAPVAESYLNVERVLAAARESGAEAIHPGYGFLSENAAFARACAEAGLVFIGPGVEAIEVMGNKAEAKRRMIGAGVPCVPGYEGADQADSAFEAAAQQIGFPVMVKAAAGGGGRGMRLVQAAGDLCSALSLARSEAENAFGSGELILEKAVRRPRHVEIQVFADDHGNVLHLGERDCSVQRRHQKVIEEAPCPVMTDQLRAAMGAAAVEAARSIGYRGAGTVEFLLDGDGTFYFLEMNTRLQVEHPVTEMITGVDLVAMQIEVAQGKPLVLRQEHVELGGHAIEVRLYAERTAEGFLPSTGTVDLWSPAMGEGLRVDAGIESGQAVSPFYDPMLAKVIAWGPNRATARRRLVGALQNSALFGVFSNRDFLIAALQRETFIQGKATTAFIEEEFSAEDLADPLPSAQQLAVAAVLEHHHESHKAQQATVSSSPMLMNWSSSGLLTARFRYPDAESIGPDSEASSDEPADADAQPNSDMQPNTNTVELIVSPVGATTYRVTQGQSSRLVELLDCDDDSARVEVDGGRHSVRYWIAGPGVMHLSMDGRTRTLRNANATGPGTEEAAGGGRVTAPMHGMLLEIFVAEGATVSKGDRLAILEAMKMQHEILAAVDGKVVEVAATVGVQVAADDLLVVIEEEEDA